MPDTEISIATDDVVGGCPRCESLPRGSRGSGRLYPWAPLGHTMTKVRRYLAANSLVPEKAAGGGLVVAVGGAGPRECISGLAGEVLTGTELGETRALFKPAGEELEVVDIPRVEPLARLAGLGRSEWLLDLLSGNRLTCHFQPIVSVRNPGEIYAQECFLRGVGEDGAPIPLGSLLGATRESGMRFQTDLAARRTAILEAAARGIGTNLFVNFTPPPPPSTIPSSACARP